jgi:threonine dehydrogenase-like Zn-dependent dehydrogenase
MPERHVFKLPDELSMDEGALIEPASIAYDAFKNTHLTEKDSVVVYGTGAIGLICIWLAKYYGAGKVIAVGRNENKLKIAQELGADILINNQKENAVKRIKDVCDGKGANMIIEATGAESALIDCINSIARYGRLSLLSFYEKPMNNIPIDPLVLGCVTVVGAAGCAGNAQAVCKIMCDNKAKLSPIITHHVKFEDCLDVFENEFKYHNEKIKIMIDFD